MKRLILLFPATALIWFLIPIGAGILNIGNGLGIAICSFLLLWGFTYAAFKRRAASHGREKGFQTANRVLAALFSVGFLWAGALTVWMVLATQTRPPIHSTVIVLGSQVRGTEPSLDLWARIDAAEKFLNEVPEAMCIASGGQGPGELVSEASVIREKLIERGISPERIILEDKSRNTRQNIQFSKALLKEHGRGGTTVAIVTDEYHQLRAALLAKQEGLTPCAVPARTPWFILPAFYMRELLALTQVLLLPGT